jgi:nicotinate-nucleotide adenylyltransferase
MTAAAIAGDARFALSRIELERAGPSYTVETLRLLRERWGAEATIVLILGWDMLASLPTWHDAAGVVARTDQLAAAHRPGFPPGEHELEELEAQLPGLGAKLTLIPAPQIDLAATTIRERVALTLPIRYLIPDAVREYIEREELYRDRASAPTPASQHTEGEAPA